MAMLRYLAVGAGALVAVSLVGHFDVSSCEFVVGNWQDAELLMMTKMETGKS
jgi:hypothetical protein